MPKYANTTGHALSPSPDGTLVPGATAELTEEEAAPFLELGQVVRLDSPAPKRRTPQAPADKEQA